MKILMISGSRADHNAISMVGEELARLHQVVHASLWSYLNIHDDPKSQTQQIGYVVHAVNGYAPDGIDLAFVCGDRWEILAASVALYSRRIPIAHLSGGDITSGSADNAMRNAISMLASLHFPTSEQSAKRLASIGCDPRMIFNVGSPVADRIRRNAMAAYPVSRRDLAFDGLMKPNLTNIIVALHPETIGPPDRTCQAVLGALRAFDGDHCNYYFTQPNGDVGRDIVTAQIEAFCSIRRSRASIMPNLHPDQFVWLMGSCFAIVGNSSVCVIEAPMVGLPSIAVGQRQEGRPLAAWRYVPAEPRPILEALYESDGAKIEPTKIFGDGRSCEKIASILDRLGPASLLRVA